MIIRVYPCLISFRNEVVKVMRSPFFHSVFQSRYNFVLYPVFAALFSLSVVLSLSKPALGECADISGDWDYYSSGKVRCSGGGETETEKTSDSGTITIDQNSCKVSWEVSEYNVKRKGSVRGNKIKVSGKFAIALASGVKFTQNTYTAQGKINGDEIALRGSGKVAGTYQGVSFSCTGNDKTTFTRSSNEEEYVRKPSVKKKTARKSSTSFSGDSFENLPKCVPIKIIGE